MGRILILFLLYINLALANNTSIQNLLLDANLPKSSKQVIVVKSTTKVMANVTAWQKSGATWKLVYNSIPANVGSQGISENKIEGDNKTPKGLFPLGTAFGNENLNLNIAYRQLTEADKFIDDKDNKDYNRWITGDTDADSYETMLRKDGVYNLGIVIDYNMNPVVPGKGSAIFMHIWYRPNIGTTGCVAMDQTNLLKLLRWLNKKDNPYILITN